MKLYNGDCLSVLRDLDDNSIDSIITDPPYGLSSQKKEDVINCLFAWSKNEKYAHNKKGFMGKSWDGWVPDPDVWSECYRVLKHGGHIAAFSSTRTSDLMSISMRLAGFESRDMIMWVFGSGVPKGNNIAGALEKEMRSMGIPEEEIAAKLSVYDDTHVLLKPAYEPILLFRKPLEGTVAQNIIKYKTGVLNTKACRIPDSLRFPSNFIHDGSHDVLSLFPNSDKNQIVLSNNKNTLKKDKHYADKGSAARFFYCPKASKVDREEGLDAITASEKEFLFQQSEGATKSAKNTHPTVKPIGVMQYLCKLVTPPKGIILDPFMGSGSTGKAAISEGFEFIGIEREEEYFNIAQNRIQHSSSHYNNNSRLFQ